MSGLLFTLFTHAIVLLSSTTDQPQQQVSLCQRNSTSNRQSPYTVLVEGNVGSGKSTLVNILAGVEPRIDAIPEPVEAWQNVSGNLITAPLNKYLTINHATGRQPSFVKAVPDQYISVWKCPKKSHSTLRAKRHMFTFWGEKFIKNAKNGPFWRILKTLSFAVKQCYQTGHF